ncbi:ABC transporter [Colletotrichum higginsianum IMI 349063]|uniref:ABC transporter n=2 Tax=Colletotrichum higginsianum TaxID=80884 RepID=A0A1B7YNT6_COLHI|nr:ABC transporter [Colletotrichum higginsianum IMI 349063]OBR13683.1 ABC transporter [Colletotrichum higginsianum IMI 349063]TID01711.1 ABC transporter G family member 12 [Colletotrichum higginsianum]
MATHGSHASATTAKEYAGHGFFQQDVEMGAPDAHLFNTTVHNVSWDAVEVTVKDRETKKPKKIVDQVDGLVEAGEICALMGPSGCGKTTLLNFLAGRPTNASSVGGAVLVNGATPSRSDFRRISCFVEQEDALIGSLTVRETLLFTSRLASSSLPAAERIARVDGLLAAFGLEDQADTIVGTPIRKGISGGQKRRVGVASQLITSPKILFLDEPTSGLDSAASYEVVSYLRKVAKRSNLVVIASIHQPSSSTFNLFDKLLLLSAGRTHYFGPVDGVVPYYESLGMPIPLQVNPAEHVLELVNTDFVRDKREAAARLEAMRAAWDESAPAKDLRVAVADVRRHGDGTSAVVAAADDDETKPNLASLVVTLLHRGFVKSYRDVVAYGIRFAMYTGLALMMGTVWVRLSTDQSSIIPLTNAIFFGGAFMSFMAVAYVPAFLEDRSQYVKEHHNGLYGATALLVSNFLLGLPYLFLIALVFSAISYWLSNFRPAADAFFVWVLWLFLDLLAAESLVVLFTSLFPSFVVSLALVAFANGLWMSVNGFMVSPTILNAFYRYVFHYWDYQKYVFEGMMRNEFAERTYTCGDGCRCMFQTPLAGECKIAGQGVLDTYGYTEDHFARNVGIMLAIIAGYRLAAWAVLKLKKN